MNTKMLKYILFLLVLLGTLSSCHDDQLLDARGDWVYNAGPDTTITLTFKSGKAYVNTFPQELNSSYFFRNGDQYTVRGDTLYWVDPNDPSSHNPYFAGTMLSDNKMKLHFLGMYVMNAIYVTDYLFERKN